MKREFTIVSEGVKFESINGEKSVCIDVFVNGIKFTAKHKWNGWRDDLSEVYESLQEAKNELFNEIIDMVAFVFEVTDSNMEVLDPALRELIGFKCIIK